MLGREHTLRPAGSARGNRVEVLQRCKPAAGAVVVAAHKGGAQPANALDHLVWIGAIPNRVAEVPHCVVLGCQLEHRMERLEVRVDVGKQQRAHQVLSYVSLHRSRRSGAANPVPRRVLPQRTLTPARGRV